MNDQNVTEHISMLMHWTSVWCSFSSLCWSPASLCLPSPTLNSNSYPLLPRFPRHTCTHTGWQHHPRPQGTLEASSAGKPTDLTMTRIRSAQLPRYALCDPGLLSSYVGSKTHLWDHSNHIFKGQVVLFLLTSDFLWKISPVTQNALLACGK